MHWITDDREVYVDYDAREWIATMKGDRIQYFFLIGNCALVDGVWKDDKKRLNQHRSWDHGGAIIIPPLLRDRKLYDGIQKSSSYNKKKYIPDR